MTESCPLLASADRKLIASPANEGQIGQLVKRIGKQLLHGQGKSASIAQIIRDSSDTAPWGAEIYHNCFGISL